MLMKIEEDLVLPMLDQHSLIPGDMFPIKCLRMSTFTKESQLNRSKDSVDLEHIIDHQTIYHVDLQIDLSIEFISLRVVLWLRYLDWKRLLFGCMENISGFIGLLRY